MPRTIELNVRQTRLILEALEGKRKILSRSLNGKRHRWAQEQILALDEVADELRKPVMVERTNLMTGAKYMEEEGTPNYCSPSSEAYWSM